METTAMESVSLINEAGGFGWLELAGVATSALGLIAAGAAALAAWRSAQSTERQARISEQMLRIADAQNEISKRNTRVMLLDHSLRVYGAIEAAQAAIADKSFDPGAIYGLNDAARVAHFVAPSGLADRIKSLSEKWKALGLESGSLFEGPSFFSGKTLVQSMYSLQDPTRLLPLKAQAEALRAEVETLLLVELKP
jgi:hypothetical protein